MEEYPTPFGWMTEEKIKKIEALGIWRATKTKAIFGKTFVVAPIVERVAVEKTKTIQLKSGEEKTVTTEEVIFIPVRFYNLDFYLFEHNEDLDLALKAFHFGPTEYLPKSKGFSSYLKLFEHVQNERSFREQREADSESSFKAKRTLDAAVRAVS